MFWFRRASFLAFALIVSAGVQGAAAAPPKINKPKPAPADLPSSIPPLPPAVIDPSLAVGGEEVNAKKIETRLSVDVLVNGSGPYRFIVDSGADTSVVGLRIARALELPLGTPAVLNGMTSRDIVDRVKVDELGLGSTVVRDLQLPALQEAHVGGAGILGIDALVQQRLMMDFEKKVIRIEDASVRYRPQRGEIVVTGRRYRGQLILTRVRAAGQRLDAVVDTGTQVTIGNLALRDELFKERRVKFITVPVTGVTGVEVDLQMAYIDDLQIGPITISGVLIAFADVPPFKLFGLSEEPALLLGTDLLETFRRVSLDFKERKARFQLKRCEAEGVIISTDPRNASRLSSTGTYDVCGR